jgi:hypothetical protein
MRFVKAALSSAILPTLLGCGPQNQCPKVGQTKCGSSTQVVICEPFDNSDTFGGGESLQWEPAPGRPGSAPGPCATGDSCVEAEGQAFCSPVSAPVQECAADGYSCWQNSVVQCTGGFPMVNLTSCQGATCATTADRTCGYCLPPDTMAVSDPGCASSSTCGANLNPCSPTCVGNSVYQCNCGLRLAQQTDCGDAGVCVNSSVDNSGALCALSSAADPQCVRLGTTGRYCGDGGLVQCSDGYIVSFTPCSCNPAPFFCNTLPEAGTTE